MTSDWEDIGFLEQSKTPTSSTIISWQVTHCGGFSGLLKWTLCTRGRAKDASNKQYLRLRQCCPPFVWSVRTVGGLCFGQFNVLLPHHHWSLRRHPRLCLGRPCPIILIQPPQSRLQTHVRAIIRVPFQICFHHGKHSSPRTLCSSAICASAANTKSLDHATCRAMLSLSPSLRNLPATPLTLSCLPSCATI